MSIIVIGVNHTTAPLSIREKVYFALDALPLYLQDMLHRGYANEAVLLSTCNRSELYCDTNDVGLVREWFYAQTMLPEAEITPATYLYHIETVTSERTSTTCWTVDGFSTAVMRVVSVMLTVIAENLVMANPVALTSTE